MPNDALDDILESDLDHLASIYVLREGPLPELFLLFIEEDILRVILLSLSDDLVSGLIYVSSIETRLNNVHKLLISSGKYASIFGGAPLDAVHYLIVQLVLSENA